MRAKKYFKLKTAEISKNLILTRKQRTIVAWIKEKIGKSDIEKCSNAYTWILFIKLKPGEPASDFVSRFKKAESQQQKNVKIVIPDKALAIHLMNKSASFREYRDPWSSNYRMRTDLTRKDQDDTLGRRKVSQEPWIP